jgi:hypothetical protein
MLPHIDLFIDENRIPMYDGREVINVVVVV